MALLSEIDAADDNDPEAFLSAVDDAASVINGLCSGQLSANSSAVELASQKISRLAGRREQRTKTQSQSEAKCSNQAEATEVAQDDPVSPSRALGSSEQVQRKVEELKEAFLQRERARERFQRYTEARAERDLRRGLGDTADAAAAAAAKKMPTDYRKWELFTPSVSDDEDEEILRGYRPNTPEVKAMEADIEERHRRQRERRQTAERQRSAGNHAFARRQYSEALRCYLLGLEADKHNMVLHCNAALVSIKLSCPVQAIGRCAYTLKHQRESESERGRNKVHQTDDALATLSTRLVVA